VKLFAKKNKQSTDTAPATRLSGAALQPQGSTGNGTRSQLAPKPVSMSDWALWRGRRAFRKNRADFYEDLAEALDDKAVLVTELKKHVVRTHRRRPSLAALYSLWLRRMDKTDFSLALKGTVPPMDSLVLLSAENSGNLPYGLRFLSTTVRAVGKIKGSIVTAVAMPIIVSSMSYGMLVGFYKFMAPILEQIMPVKKWPGMGRFIYHLSGFVTDYSIPLFAGVGGLIALFIWSLSNWKGPARRKIDNYLPYSIYRDYNSAVMLVSLSGLMQSGSSLVGSLKSMRASSTPWMNWHIGQILVKLDREASQPARAFDTGVLPPYLFERVVDYGERSTFQEALNKLGKQTLERVEKSVATKSKALNYILLFISGVLMGLIIVSVMLTAQNARTQLTAHISSTH
jgi:hypothetical protein